jgi:hypothetical protein
MELLLARVMGKPEQQRECRKSRMAILMNDKRPFYVLLVTCCIAGIAMLWLRQRSSQKWAWGTYDGSHFGTPPGRYELSGTAQGGILCLLGPTRPQFACVQTSNGESADSILRRLAEEINRSDPFCWLSGPNGQSTTYGGPAPTAVVKGHALIILDNYCWFSGTDQGFGIPKPICSLSGSYDRQKRQITLSWIDAPEPYDDVIVQGEVFPRGTTRCVVPCDNQQGATNGSIVAEVHVRRRRMLTEPAFSLPAEIVLTSNSQEELEAYPFCSGVAPNWSAWSDATRPDGIVFEQGRKSGVALRREPRSADEKPFYQLIKATNDGDQGGVWRRFVGLVPSHTYRVKVRLNTLNMDSFAKNWRFSFHATQDYPGGRGLTNDQLSGDVPLPDGTSGHDAGCVALYALGNTTAGKWIERSTGEPAGSAKDIALAKGVTSITVWLRYSGASSSGVGMDWIKLEDITVTESGHSGGEGHQ